MNKTELVAAIAEKAGLTKKDAEAAVKAFVEVVEEEVKADKNVSLIGFGTFDLKKNPARNGRNPKTGEALVIAESFAPRFKAGKAFKDAVNCK